jgi:tRNA (guanine37-N1)-methyltransferase
LTLRIDVVTLFPGVVAGPLGESMLRVAQDRGALAIRVVDLRDYTEGRHRVADDYPFGGGGGMVLKPEPLFAAVEALRGAATRVVLLCPQGPTFTQATASRLARETHLVLLCGHYEGVDERVRECLVDEEISIGDYVLTGGELPALVVIDAVARLLPGVLGDPAGAERESFAAGRLDYPQYTRPAEFRGLRVPDVLLSGDHAGIARWRRREAIRRTLARRPDLVSAAPLTDEERGWVDAQGLDTERESPRGRGARR